jgi:hypothetical protein
MWQTSENGIFLPAASRLHTHNFIDTGAYFRAAAIRMEDKNHD